MELEELRKLIDDLQNRRFEPDATEAKAARATPITVGQIGLTPSRIGSVASC